MARSVYWQHVVVSQHTDHALNYIVYHMYNHILVYKLHYDIYRICYLLQAKSNVLLYALDKNQN